MDLDGICIDRRRYGYSRRQGSMPVSFRSQETPKSAAMLAGPSSLSLRPLETQAICSNLLTSTGRLRVQLRVAEVERRDDSHHALAAAELVGQALLIVV